MSNEELTWEDLQKREEEARKQLSDLQKQMREMKAKSSGVTTTTTTTVGAEEDTLGSDEASDVKPRQTKWSAECASTLPDFNKVRENSRTVEGWCKSAKAVLAEYRGSVGLIRQAVMENVKLPEFKRPSFDPCAFSVNQLLDFIQTTWQQRYAKTTLELVLAKEPAESWCDFLDRLRQFNAKKGYSPPDDWYLTQLRANTSSAADIMCGQMPSADDWALAMDTELGIYNKSKAQSVNAVQVEVQEDSQEVVEESVDAIKEQKGRRGLHRYTQDSRPICDLCQQAGHIARSCPKRKGFRGRGRRRFFPSNARLVYSINENDAEPIVISVGIRGQTINAMLDSGAMENVIDVETLRRIAPSIHLALLSQEACRC